MPLEIRFNEAPLGHEIAGVDVRNLSEEEFRQIEEAYDTYGVIVFRGQKLTPDEQVAFSRRFGPLEQFVLQRYNLKTHPEVFVVSNIIENGEPIGLGDAGQYWHTDMWVVPVPPRGSMLYALEVPEENGVALGDTCFASTAAAYDALPADLRERIESLEAVYGASTYVEYRMAEKLAETGRTELTDAERIGLIERAKNIPERIRHPLVRRHPRTGRKCLYFSEGAISHIEGLSKEESNEILDAIRAHLLRPEFLYRHKWQVGDIVMWDNTSCIHKAISDYAWPQRRRMHRTTLAHNPKAY